MSKATPEDIERAETELGRSIPARLRKLYASTDGLTRGWGLVIYSTRDIAERNATFEVDRYAPGYVAVGDDGGGRILLLSDNDARWVDVGSLDPASSCAFGWSEWVARGFLAPSENVSAAPDRVGIYLDRVPDGGLKSLIAIKTELGLALSPHELKALVEEVPIRVQTDVAYARARKRIRSANDRVGACLSLRAIDEPTHHVAC